MMFCFLMKLLREKGSHEINEKYYKYDDDLFEKLISSLCVLIILLTFDSIFWSIH